MNSKLNRYVVTLQFYVWSEDEEGAKVEARRVEQELDLKYDNRADVMEIHEQPFGTLWSRKIESKK
jgi:hypothetical protein